MKPGKNHSQPGLYLASAKSGKSRKLTPAPSVMKLLRHQQAVQAEWRLRAGAAWQDSGLVFTNKPGGHRMPHTVYQNYKMKQASAARMEKFIQSVSGR